MNIQLRNVNHMNEYNIRTPTGGKTLTTMAMGKLNIMLLRILYNIVSNNNVHPNNYNIFLVL